MTSKTVSILINKYSEAHAFEIEKVESNCGRSWACDRN